MRRGVSQISILTLAAVGALALPGSAPAAQSPPMNPKAFAAFCMGIQGAEAGKYDAALVWLEAALKADPKAAYVHVWIGTICDEKLSRPNKAKTHFQAALKLDPGNFRARYGLARQQLRKGDGEKAREQMLIAVSMPSASENPSLVAKAYTELAAAAEARGKWERAAEYYGKAAAVSPNPAYLLLRLGRLYRSINEYGKAAAALTRLRRMVPSYARIHRELCDTYKSMGRWSDALAQLESYMSHRRGPGEQDHLLREAAEIATRGRMAKRARFYHEKLLLALLKRYTPDKAAPGLCQSIAQTLISLGRDEHAEPYMLKAVEAAKEKTKPYLRLRLAAIYQKLKRTGDAVAQLNKSIKSVEPRASIRFRTELCATYESAKRYDEAEKALSAILEVTGAKAVGHAELGLFHERRGNVEKAVQELRKAVKLADTQTGVRYKIQLGSIYSNAKRFQEAEHVLAEAQKLHPGNAAINNALAWFYAERSMKLGRAMELVQKALKVNPRNPYYIDSLAWIYFRQGHKKRALEQLLRAVALAENGTIYDHLGDVYFGLGKPQEAAGHWRRSLELDPDIKGVREKIKKAEAKPDSTP
jgi:tetratricopeptide (TPR) repeat protein